MTASTQVARLTPPDALWERLTAFRLDIPGVATTFSERLARENGWSAVYTARVLAEYRKFLYLACCAGHEVTPSDAVDQAWHLHLTFTQSYWEDLCRDTLERPIHHGPTRGGIAEARRFEHAYQRTLGSYAARFGAPPADVWPDPDVHFATQSFQRLDRARYLLVPKAALRAASGAVGAVLALVGCAATLGSPSVSWPFWVLGTGLLVAMAVTPRKRSRPRERAKRRTSRHGCVNHAGGSGFPGATCGAAGVAGHGGAEERDRAGEGSRGHEGADGADSGAQDSTDTGAASCSASACSSGGCSSGGCGSSGGD